jgi:hypothetical protein
MYRRLGVFASRCCKSVVSVMVLNVVLYPWSQLTNQGVELIEGELVRHGIKWRLLPCGHHDLVAVGEDVNVPTLVLACHFVSSDNSL